MRVIHALTSKKIGVLAVILVIFSVLKIPSLIEPYWYGDEGIYLVIGKALNNGSILYRDIWDNKPPLLYLLYAVLGSNLFLVKLVFMMVGLATVVMFYNLAAIILRTQASVYIATILFALLFSLPLLEANIANAENIMLLPIISAFYILFSGNGNVKNYFFAGLLLSVAILTKMVAVFDTAALIFIMVVLASGKGKLSSFLSFAQNRSVYMLIVGLCVLPILSLIVFGIMGSLPAFFHGVFAANVSYVEYENHFIIPMGGVLFKLFLLALSLGGIYTFRRHLLHEEKIILSWLTFAVFSVFFSDRPYTHYLLMGIAPFALLAGLIVSRWVRFHALVLLGGIASLVLLFFPLYKKNIGYYTNYTSYVFGDRTFREYVAFFDRNALRDYDVAYLMKDKIKDTRDVYFWSDSAQLYMLTQTMPPGKYTVAYHVLMYEDALHNTISTISRVSPQYIVSTKRESIPQQILDNYRVKYTFETAKIYEKI